MAVETEPKGPRTGHSHPGCYARALADCSDKISREHYVSEKLLGLRMLKGDRLTDWSRRPLTADQQAYAAVLDSRR